MQVMPPSRAVIFALAMALGASAHSAAQARSRAHVVGHTTDTEGSPLPGVTVTVMGVSIRFRFPRRVTSRTSGEEFHSLKKVT